MQKSAQYRLIYFVLMVATFAGGYYFLPDTIRLPQDKWLTHFLQACILLFCLQRTMSVLL